MEIAKPKQQEIGMWNYEAEVKKVDDRPVVEKFKPDKDGFYRLKILTEPERTLYQDPKDPATKSTEQIVLRILHDGREKLWYIPVGQTPRSAYYKLMYIGKHYRGLMGLELKANLTMVKNAGGIPVRSWEFPQYFEIKEKESS